MSQSPVDKLRRKLEEASPSEALTFRPSRDQQIARSAFWSTFSSGDIEVPETVDLAVAIKWGLDKRISEWWTNPAFIDWFQNRHEFHQRTEHLALSSLLHLENIISDSDANPSARVAAIKLAMELSGKLASKKTDAEFTDKKINEMTPQQLEAFIRAKTISLVPTVPQTDLTSTD